MRRIFRGLLILILLVLLGVGVSALIVHQRVMAKPAWYSRPTPNAVARRAAANIADHKFIDTFGAARAAQAREAAARHAGAAGLPATAPSADPITLELTEEEINAFFGKWAESVHWTQLMNGNLAVPDVILEGHELILATDVKGKWNTVISLHFEPRLVDGKLDLHITSVMAGTLTMPRSLFAGYEQNLEEMVLPNLPSWRKSADITSEGWVNKSAKDAAMTELLLHALQDEVAEPVLFFPDMTHLSRSLPVQVTAVGIEDKKLTLTVIPMNPAQRAELLKHLKGGETEKGE